MVVISAPKEHYVLSGEHQAGVCYSHRRSNVYRVIVYRYTQISQVIFLCHIVWALILVASFKRIYRIIGNISF